MLKALVKDTVIYGFSDILFKLIGLFTFPIFAYIFSVEEFGLLALVSTMCSLVGVFVNVGLNNATQRYYYDKTILPEQRPVVITSGLVALTPIVVVIVSLLILLTYRSRVMLLDRYGLPWHIVAFGLVTIIPGQIYQFSVDALRLQFAPWKFSLMSFLQNSLGLVAALVFVVYLKMGLTGVMVGGLLCSCVTTPLSLWFVRRDLCLQVDLDLVRKLLRFGFPFIFSGMGYWIFGSMDRWMLAEMSTIEEVGIYSIAFKFATLVIFVNMAFGQAWSPRAMLIYREDEHYRETFGRFFTFWFFLLVGLGVGICAFAREALQILAPPAYWPAARVVPWLIMGMVMYGTTQVTAIGISLEKRSILFSYGAWLTAIVNLCVNFLLIPLWGSLGAAVATLVSYLFLTSFYLVWSQKLHPIVLEYGKLQIIFGLSVLGVATPYIADTFSPGLMGSCIKTSFVVVFFIAGHLCGIVDYRKYWRIGMARLKAPAPTLS